MQNLVGVCVRLACQVDPPWVPFVMTPRVFVLSG